MRRAPASALLAALCAFSGTPDRPPTEGVGYAFPEDPSHGAHEEVALPGLHGDGLRLDGTYVRVRSVRIDPGSPLAAEGPVPDYRYPPGPEGPERCTLELPHCDRFDAVNVYWHVDRVARTFWRDRMGIDPAFQADAVVHLAGNGAVADPHRHLLQFRLGDTYTRNAAREDDIVYHEYAHLVAAQLGFVVDTTSVMPARAVSEGFADYFAATFTDDPGIGEYWKACTPRQECVGPRDDPDVRTLATDPATWNWRYGQPEPELKYGVCTRWVEIDGKCKTIWLNTSAVYVWGMIWGATLWDVRTLLSADVADRLAIGAMRRLRAPRATLESAAGALLAADLEQNGGVHRSSLEAVLARRGILPDRAGSVAVVPPAGAAPLPVDVYPVPASSIVRVRATGVSSAEVFDVLGRIRRVDFEATGTLVTLDLASIPAGRWWIRLLGPHGGTVAPVRPVVVVR